MAYNKNDITHSFAYLYVAFAHLTDGVINDAELKNIAAKVWGWLDTFENDVTGDGKIDVNDVKQILFDDVIPFYDSMDGESRCAEFGRIVDTQMAQEWWNDEFSTSVLKDMENLAKADGNYHENEKKWMGIMADQYGVSVPA